MFLDFLLSQHIIDELQYNRVMAELDHEYHGDITAALVALGLSEDSITQTKAGFYQLPYIKVDKNDVKAEVTNYISEDAARQYKFIPLSITDGVLSIGVTEPENMEAMNALQFISVKLGIPFKIFLISPTDLDELLAAYKSATLEVDKEVSELDKELKGGLGLGE
jgi:hypothetical protein